MPRLDLPERKQLRTQVIKEHIEVAGYHGVVCFSYGNASRELQLAGLDTIAVTPDGDLRPGRWWSPAEIHTVWPSRFDATSGYLPLWMMLKIGQVYRDHIGHLRNNEKYIVPTGSGETIMCLRWTYPQITFIAEYSDRPGTRYEAQAPLNDLVFNTREEQRR